VSWRRVTHSVDETRRAGAELADLLVSGDVVLLEGPLGAGKTALAQGIGRGLGVIERVTSPTFTVVRQHACHARGDIRTLHHADVYRTNGPGEILDLALGELVEEDAVAVIEWGELAGGVIGGPCLRVVIEVLDDDERALVIESDDDARADACSKWATL
jgi:tRNA threonylcarbamoyladenosine biosynthesis protein TsaE